MNPLYHAEQDDVDGLAVDDDFVAQLEPEPQPL